MNASNSSSSSSSSSPKFNVSYVVQAGHTGVGPFGTKGRCVIVKDHEDREVRLFARAIEDLEVKEINKKQYGIALPEGAVDAKNHKVEYHPVKLMDNDGKEKVFLVAHERAVDAFKPYSKEKDARKPEHLAPGAVTQFLKQHAASNWDIDAAIKGAKGEASPEVSGDLSTSRAETALRELEGDVVYYTSQSLGISSGQAKQLKDVASRYKETDEWNAYNGSDAFNRGEPFRVASGVPLHIGDKEWITPPFGMLIGREYVPGQPDVEILIKGKLAGNRGVFRRRPSYHLRKKGADKTVKYAMDAATGKFRVQISVDVGARARQYFGFEDKLFNDLDVEERYQVEGEIEDSLRRCEAGVENQNKYSGLEPVRKQTTFAAKPTKPEKVKKREMEGKAIRKEGDTVFTYTMPLALGDMTSPELYKAVRSTTNVTAISPEFSAVLTGTAGTVGKLHADDMVHRDLKPDNLFAFEKPTKDGVIVRVMDYDYCHKVSKDGTAIECDEKTGKKLRPPPIAGTPFTKDPELFYLSLVKDVPELDSQYVKKRKMNDKDIQNAMDASVGKVNLKQADVYSLGCTWYELLMADEKKGDTFGQTPYAKRGDDILNQVNALIQRCAEVGRRPDQATLASIRTRLIQINSLEKQQAYLAEARANLGTKCPPVLVDLIIDMMAPDPKQRPPINPDPDRSGASVLERLAQIPGYQKPE